MPPNRSLSDRVPDFVWGFLGDLLIAGGMPLFASVLCFLFLSFVAVVAPTSIFGFGVGSESGGALGLFYALFVFIPALAPFFAVAFWVSAHGTGVGVETPTGVYPLESATVVSGGLELVPPVMLVVAGVVVAIGVRGPLVTVPPVATVAGVAGYTSGAVVLLVVTAFLFNTIFVPVSAAISGSLYGTSATVFEAITYTSAVDVGRTIAAMSAPYIVGGVAVGTGFRVLRHSWDVVTG